jgi:hypothetical protein
MITVGIKLARQIAEHQGYYSDDPRVMRIVEYTDMGGKQAYGLEYEHQVGKYTPSPYVRNPKVYWQAKELE